MSYFTAKQEQEIATTAARRRLERKEIRYNKRKDTMRSKRNKILTDRVVELTKSEDIAEYVNADKKLTLSKESIITLAANGFKVGEISRALKVTHGYVSKILGEVDEITLNNRKRRKSVYEAYDHIISCATDKVKDDRYKGSDIAKMVDIGMERYEPVNKHETTIHVDLATKLNEARKRIEAENVIEIEAIEPLLLEEKSITEDDKH